MKIFIVLLAAVLFLALPVYAHPPRDITITFDPATKEVTAVITHNVSNPATHFIDKVDIAVNGKEIIELKISRQDNNSGQTVRYIIPDVKPGDTVSVEGYCNLSGKLLKEIKIA